jgi:hypothetical protein
MSDSVSFFELRIAGAFINITEKIDTSIYYSPKSKVFFYNTHIVPNDQIIIEFQYITEEEMKNGKVGEREFKINEELNRTKEHLDTDLKFNLNISNVILPVEVINDVMLNFVENLSNSSECALMRPFINDLTNAINESKAIPPSISNLKNCNENEIITVHE